MAIFVYVLSEHNLYFETSFRWFGATHTHTRLLMIIRKLMVLTRKELLVCDCSMEGNCQNKSQVLNCAWKTPVS